MNKRQRGKAGEDAAVDFLQEKGYRILARNFRFDRGEMDIIAEDNNTLVFVEVKARYSTNYAGPEEAVTESKKNQMEKVAEGYLVERGIEGQECRFDIIAVEWQNDKPVVRHIVDAF